MQLKILATSAIALGFVALASGAATAQGVSVTPMVGAYVPGGSFGEIRQAASDVEREREGAFGLGLNVELGWLRGSFAYATGAQINESGVADRDNLGKGSVLVGTADLVIRPIPRLLVVQPYIVAGGGLKNQNFDYDDDTDVSDAFPRDDTDPTLHIGIGADIMLGSLGIVAEISDFISRNNDDKWKVHDAFGFVGLKLRLF